tara:strand:+ start:3563 stop:3769 length:207 start_codon:yes stop_codon:yes gene_type:complete
MKCKHYFSTFDPAKPRGCKLYAMKTVQFPEVIVKRESGKECLGFEPRKKVVEREKPRQIRDFNDPSLW